MNGPLAALKQLVATADAENAQALAQLEAHRNKLEANKEVFDRNVKEKRMGDLPESTAALPPPAPAEIPATSVPCTPVPAVHEVRGQKLAVFSVLPGHEPVVTVYAAFENEDDAKHYIDATLSQHVLDLDLFVHPMYEWIQLDAETMESALIPRKYRHPILDSIMRQKRQQGRDIEQYYAKCREAGIEPTITEVEPEARLTAAAAAE